MLRLITQIVGVAMISVGAFSLAAWLGFLVTGFFVLAIGFGMKDEVINE